MGFYPLLKHGVDNNVNLTHELLNTYNLDINRYRGQGYYGTSVMSGVQKIISNIVPSASYVHCTAHNPNSVISHIARSTQKLALFKIYFCFLVKALLGGLW